MERLWNIIKPQVIDTQVQISTMDASDEEKIMLALSCMSSFAGQAAALLQNNSAQPLSAHALVSAILKKSIPMLEIHMKREIH